MTEPERYQLAPDLSISRVVTGLWQIADMERDGRTIDLDRTALAMAPYLDAGLSTFDMADHYGSAELVAGRFRAGRDPASRPVLLTKWVPTLGTVTKDDVRAAIDRARTRLGVAAIDLLQFHAWRYSDPSWLDCLFWLAEFKEEGLVRHLGVTNFDAVHLDLALASGIPIVSNQVCYSLLDRRAGGALAEVCRKHGVGLLCYGTVAGGFLTERWLDRPEPNWSRLDTWSEMKYGRFIRAAGGWAALQRVLAATSAIARKHGVSMANVACRQVLDQPGVAAIIVGARLGSSSHLEDNRRVFGFRFDREDRERLDAALDTLAPIPGDSGDEYRKPPYLTASGDLSHHLDEFPTPYPVRSMGPGRTAVLTGTVWEPLAGFSRATRVGNRILVSGTTATHRDRRIGGDDPAAQTHFILDKIQGAIESLGGSLDHVVRTRIFLSRLADWEPVARAHGQRFGAILPANTLVRADLIGDGYLVEIEAEADVPA
jgi:aryl-alcohol dehydrogenase-like predicted oxidoreductase/enamine deaminase RidA (YjgF/YER057c/UK114 family)